MTENEILEQAVKLWGADMQVLMMVEEMSELTKALIKYWRNPSVETLEHIAEEVADVEITTAQLDIIFKNDDFNSKVMSWKDSKLKRLEQRISEAKLS